MRMPNGHSCRPSLGSALLAVLILCAGCQTATKRLFTASGPGWRVQEGQALWCPGRDLPEISGDLVLVVHEDGRCLIQFDKTPLSLVSVQTTRTRMADPVSGAADGVQWARAGAHPLCLAISAHGTGRGNTPAAPAV